MKYPQSATCAPWFPLSSKPKTWVQCALWITLGCLSGALVASGQSAVNAAAGVNLGNTGIIFNAPPQTSASTLTGATTSWEFSPDFQKWVVPASNLTGLGANNLPLNFEDLLPLKVTKIRVMTGAAGTAPTGVGTLIDSLGIDTTSVITDALFLTDSVTQQLVPFTISSGVLNLPQGMTFPGGWNLNINGGGLRIGAGNNTTAGWMSTVLGGWENAATGPMSMIVGGRNNATSGDYSATVSTGYGELRSQFSAIIGGWTNSIKNSASGLSAILAGQANQMTATAGSHNAIIAGFGNQISAGAYRSGIYSGHNNLMNGAGFHQVILGGQNNTITKAPNSVILGGLYNTITAIHPVPGYETHTGNAIVGGIGNAIGGNGMLSGVFAGENSTVSGQASAALGSSGAIASGLNAVVIGGAGAKAENLYASVVMGVGTVGSGNQQLTIGAFNAPSPGALFVIGRGSSNTQRSNALTVDTIGNVQASGAVQGASVATSGAVQAGSASITGQVQAATGRFTGKVRLQPQGGLSMGEFQYDPENQ